MHTSKKKEKIQRYSSISLRGWSKKIQALHEWGQILKEHIDIEGAIQKDWKMMLEIC